MQSRSYQIPGTGYRGFQKLVLLVAGVLWQVPFLFGCAGYTTQTAWDHPQGDHHKIFVAPVDLAFDWTAENRRELYTPGV